MLYGPVRVQPGKQNPCQMHIKKEMLVRGMSYKGGWRAERVAGKGEVTQLLVPAGSHPQPWGGRDRGRKWSDRSPEGTAPQWKQNGGLAW